jgi:hypothetical protein
MPRSKSIRTRTIERYNELEAHHRTLRLKMDAVLGTLTKQAKTAEWFASLLDEPDETPMRPALRGQFKP